MYETRAELREGKLEAVWPLLSARARSHPIQLGHQLLWQLFADGTEQRRDFLFQVERQAPFTVVLRSTRPPADTLDLWNIRSYEFRPHLQAGQELRFRMECVATRTVPRPGAKRGMRQDVAMQALKSLPPEQQLGRTPDDFAEEAGKTWLARQGEAAGFRFVSAAVEMLGYRRHRLPASRGGKPMVFGSLIFVGNLEVLAPEVFVAALGRGFGAAKAFGFGLMQIAQAPDASDL